MKVVGPVSLMKHFEMDNKSVEDVMSNMNKMFTIDVVYANFGHIPYGQSMVGMLHYNKTNNLGCKREDAFFNETDLGYG
jgi:hypothetical protein